MFLVSRVDCTIAGFRSRVMWEDAVVASKYLCELLYLYSQSVSQNTPRTGTISTWFLVNARTVRTGSDKQRAAGCNEAGNLSLYRKAVMQYFTKIKRRNNANACVHVAPVTSKIVVSAR